MVIWRAGTTSISEERYGDGRPDTDDIVSGLFLKPEPRFARVYWDVLHESYTVYDIDLVVCQLWIDEYRTRGSN